MDPLENHVGRNSGSHLWSSIEVVWPFEGSSVPLWGPRDALKDVVCDLTRPPALRNPTYVLKVPKFPPDVRVVMRACRCTRKVPW